MATTHYRFLKPDFLTTTYSFLPQPIPAMAELTFLWRRIPAGLYHQHIPDMQKLTYGLQQCIPALSLFFLFMSSGFLVRAINPWLLLQFFLQVHLLIQFVTLTLYLPHSWFPKYSVTT
jgi:hypothetical protein